MAIVLSLSDLFHSLPDQSLDLKSYAFILTSLPPLPRLAMMESLLTWRHLAPTAPDTLTCYPFHDRDPFVLEATPHVLFAGNQPTFKTATVTGARGYITGGVRMV